MVSYGDKVNVLEYGVCELDREGDTTIYLVEEEDDSISWVLNPERSDSVLAERKARLLEEMGKATCLLCGEIFMIGDTGNELGFCVDCQESEEFPYDLDRYYQDYDKGKVSFKGFETMDRGILEDYRKGEENE